MSNLYDRLLDLVDPSLFPRSGAVFYSGRVAFTRTSRLYILGLNPGGDPTKNGHTIADKIDEARRRGASAWSAYADECWGEHPAGEAGMQPRVRHLISRLDLEPQLVPASNVVFVRSAREADLVSEKATLLPLCWKVHAAVIDRLDIRVVACFGATAGKWVREQLGADKKVDEFVERNDRKWKSRTHAAIDGLRVVTLTHPSIADWTKPADLPTEKLTTDS